MFRKADDICNNQLVARYNAIVIDDQSLLWSVGGDFGPTGNQKKFGKEYVPFLMSQSSELPDNPDEIQKTIERVMQLARIKTLGRPMNCKKACWIKTSSSITN
jgi:hypothetical protein